MPPNLRLCTYFLSFKPVMLAMREGRALSKLNRACIPFFNGE
jgi:hypothetical protein